MAITPELTKLRVLGLEETPRAKLLALRWRYYEQKQDDHCAVDWEGYERTAGEGYMEWRQRGYVRATSSTIPFGGRRPTCHSMTVGETVDTYTALLLGEGRQPSIRVVGDDASSEAVEALFDHAGVWPQLQEGRKIGGAEGAFAILPEVIKGKMSVRTIRPEHTFIRWANESDRIPEYVIEQKRIVIEDFDKHGRICTMEMWRTRAWDETYSYAYDDVPVDSGEAPAGTPEEVSRPVDIEMSEEPVPHGAGRCPVIWIQNTISSDQAMGEPDCAAVYEQVDQLDKSLSMVMRGSRANNDPTLVVSDTRAALSQWTQRKKGYGALIEVSDKGSVELLETSGEAVRQSWESIAALEARVERRTGVVSPTPENAGAYQSGIALQILHRTQSSRAGERRNPLGVGIKQLVQVILTQLREHGLKHVGAEGKGIELPQREVKTPDEDGEVVHTLEDHELGEGRAVKLTWPPLHEPIPGELQTIADALGKLTGGQPVMSQETGVGVSCSMAQTDTDPTTELERIRAEHAAKVGEFDEALMPDVDGLTDDELEGVEGDGAQAGTTDEVAKEAMNGIQIKEMGNTIVRAGDDLAPSAAEYVIGQGFPATPPEATKAAIDSQIAFAAKKKAEAPAPPVMGEQEPELDAPAPRKREKTAEQSEEP